jgi:threonine dehydrogenase-like Zn-dependent dehydrogenase
MRTICLDKNLFRILATKALQPFWPGVVFSPLSPTRFVDIPEPPLPGPRWVRLRNRLCGICASDLHLLFLQADLRVSPVALPGSARTYLGHEVVSEVVEVGPGVSTLRAGDRVIMDTGAGSNCITQEIVPPCRHCQEGNHALCENASLGRGPAGVGGGWGDGYVAHERAVSLVSDSVDDETAVMLEPLSVGVRAALRCLPQPGEHALVVGSGTIGLGLIGALRALAPRSHITALARYPQQVAMASKLGADRVLGREDPYAAAAEITGANLYTGSFHNRMLLGGFDVVYDCVGTAHTLQDSLRLARAGGTVVLAGVNFHSLHVDLTPIWYQEVNLVGLLAHGMEEWGGARRSTYDLTVELLQAGRLSAAGMITHRFPLTRWREAVRTAASKRTGAIKVVLECQL